MLAVSKFTGNHLPTIISVKPTIFKHHKIDKLKTVIHLLFWAYGSWDSLFPISMSPTANLWVQNTIFNDKSTILLHPGTRLNKNGASQRQIYAQKMQDAQVTKSLLKISTYAKITCEIITYVHFKVIWMYWWQCGQRKMSFLLTTANIHVTLRYP